MSKFPHSPITDQIREIIGARSWYEFTEDGVFLWGKSLTNLEKELAINK